MAELAAHADSGCDIARALTSDRADSEDNETLAWAEALRRCIASHQREGELLMPWASLLALDDELGTLFDTMPTLGTLADRCEQATSILIRRKTEVAAKPDASGSIARIDAMLAAVESSAHDAISLERRITDLAAMVGKMFDAMKFDFLLDPARQLLSIGYRVAEGSLDPNCYDLLASEARLASFVAIAKGDVPSRHWFRLGRPMTPVDRGSGLISWSSSMFEDLMPSLVMRAPVGSVLEQTNRLEVR